MEPDGKKRISKKLLTIFQSEVKRMSADDFREGMDSVAGFIEKIIKVFKDLYVYLKEQIEKISK